MMRVVLANVRVWRRDLRGAVRRKNMCYVFGMGSFERNDVVLGVLAMSAIECWRGTLGIGGL